MQTKSSLGDIVVAVVFMSSFSGDGNAQASRCDTATGIFGEQEVTCVKRNCPTDSIVEHWENGILQRKSHYYFCKDSGEFLYFSDKGDTLAKSFFNRGKTVGLARQWHPDHRPASLIRHNDVGQKHGLCESWREDGTRKDSSVYRNGNFIESREYYSAGKPRYWETYKGEEITVTDTFADGTTFDNVHNPVINGFYYDPKNGKIIARVVNGSGKAIYFAEDGTNPDTCFIKNGARVRMRSK